MKKIISLLSIAAMFTIASCGPSAEEKAAIEKATQDSIAAVQKAIDDSIATATMQAMQDSITAAQMKAMEDSLAAMQEKVKKATTKPKPKVEPKPTKPEDVKPGQGRG